MPETGSANILAKLKTKRTTIKASCTRIKSFVDGVQELTPVNITHLKNRKNKLDGYWEKYDEIQTELEMIDESAAEDRASFEEAFFDLSAKIVQLIEAGTQPQIVQPPNAQPQNAQPLNAPIGVQGNNNCHIRLPKLNLPTFNGDYREWTSFSQMFQSTIIDNTTLNNIEKFQYLRGSLGGEAADCIQALDLSHDNFPTAWDMLAGRYNRLRIIIQSHVQAILEIPHMKREKCQDLRNLINSASKHVNSLKTLKRPTDQWDDLLVHILANKLDTVSFREWEDSLKGDVIPTLAQLMDFLNHKCQTLESVSQKENLNIVPCKNSQVGSRKPAVNCAATVKTKCIYCNNDHPIYFCKAFTDLPVERRLAEIRKRKFCTNCLKSTTHHAQQCNSGLCKLCKSKHNTLLHFSRSSNPKQNDDSGMSSESKPESSTSSAVVTHNSISSNYEYVLLSTALVNVYNKFGEKKQARVLLDSGSQVNLITKELASNLQLPVRHKSISISGINQLSTTSSQTIDLKLGSQHNSFQVEIECVITEKITELIPAMPISKNSIYIPKNIKLADPLFHKPSKVDMLLGVDLFWRLLNIGQIKSSPHNPTIQKTSLGWVLAGSIAGSSVKPSIVNNFFLSSSNQQLDQSLARFWQIENEFKTQTVLTPIESACERQFQETITKNSEGRLIVTLPIKPNGIQELGDSRDIALRRLYGLEKRFKHNEDLRLRYSKFMNEYLELGHMKMVDDVNLDKVLPTFYLPHHCVLKDQSPSTKLRVVFDGSCKTSSGISLNDILLVGPVVQQDLISLIIRFRTYKYVLTADIIKMYRQILVHESQTSLQRILWRDNQDEPANTYELQTVTYGTASASYLSTRCLLYLAETHKNIFPVGSEAVSNDFYVDDLLTGANSISEAKSKRDEVIRILNSSHLYLDKWAANDPSLLEDIPSLAQTQSPIILSNESETKILGVRWDPVGDCFQLNIASDSVNSRITKRNMLSEIAQIFDPLGLIAPVTIIAKLLMQELWQLQNDWDASVPLHIYTRYRSFKDQLVELKHLRIPRWLIHENSEIGIEFHGFSDASQSAYGACCYLRTMDRDGNYQTSLVTSKSRVAPLKALSLPRLELCAALLLAQVYERVLKAINLPLSRVYFWCDSTITIAWIKSQSRRWTTFVSNRVGEIQRLTRCDDWRHVQSKDNPADIVSRGANPCTLMESPLWWNGPRWLELEESQWPDIDIDYSIDDIPEQSKSATVLKVTETIPFVDELCSKYSSLRKLVRVFAYCLRISNNMKIGNTRRAGILTAEEEEQSLLVLCSLVQRVHFREDIAQLENSKPLKLRSKLSSLSPFIDENGLLRVGGRLKHSDLPYGARHPILLPKHHPLTILIIRSEHVRTLHSGTQATIYSIRRRFWPISLRSTARKIIRKCIICFRVKPVHSEVTMSDLPGTRIQPSRPFSRCGVDFGGPFSIREGKRRNAKTVKSYIAVFVCFSTKAVHIEMVFDLSSETFIGAFKRFMARRGKPHSIYSDNGTNFVGANRELSELHELFVREQMADQLSDFFNESRIEWHYIPPNAPHFGGLWESAIKSAKYHMRRIIGDAHLNYDEMNTVLCEIESIMNSRPLTALSEDPNDLQPLTPGHFLIGDALNSCCQPDVKDVNINKLSRWQRIEQLRQHFWQRWSKEYLNHLQIRGKWRHNKGEQLEVGKLVIIEQPGLAPLQWLLGRVETINLSSDGNVRSASIRTTKGLLTRPLSRLAILPTDS